MSERFIKFIPSSEAMFLVSKKGHAFRLLTIIAESARRYEGDPDGLKIGECEIGGHQNYGMSEQNYRTAKEVLILRQHIEIIETCRTRKKSTTGVTTVKTKIRLLSSSVYDINPDEGNDRTNDRLTTVQRPIIDFARENEKPHTYSKKEKKEKNKKNNTKETLGASLLAEFYFSLKSSFPFLNEKNLKTTNSQIDAVDRLLKTHSPDFIREVYVFAIAHQFWSGVVHSGISLEKNFDKINIQRTQVKQHESTTSKPVGKLAEPSEPRYQPSRVLKGNNSG